MNNLAKVTIGVASTGTACTGGYFVCKEYVFSSTSKPISTPQKKWKTVTSPSKYEEGTLGNIYGGNLLDPFDEENKEKGDELYKKILNEANQNPEQPPLQATIVDIDFQASVIQYSFKPESSPVTASLNKECKKNYEKQMEGKNETNHSKIQIGGDKGKAVWMLCSAGDPKILGLNPDGYQDNSIGKINGNELLSAKNSDNEELWKKKNREFFDLSTAPTEKMFKEFYEENKGKEHPKTLREICEETYVVVPGSEQGEKPSSEDVIKYCSLKTISF